LIVANGLFHAEAATGGYAATGLGTRAGMAVLIVLITLVGGRIVPSFTRNWLAKRSPEGLPAPFGRFDKLALALSLTALAGFLAVPTAAATGWLCLAAGIVHAVRLGRWRGWRTLAEPLVTILHVGYLFVPVGFLLLGGSILAPDAMPRAAALHAFLAGAVGVMTLAVMTRASLGHAGRPLHAGAGPVLFYLAIVGAAVSRIAAGFMPSSRALLHLAAAAWIAAFALFTIVYGPLLARRRR
jgi:uncharacterized protein involved in response to NO